jgi:hypothetical protein
VSAFNTCSEYTLRNEMKPSQQVASGTAGTRYVQKKRAKEQGRRKGVMRR